MKKEDKILLVIDSTVNIVIGIILLCFPLGIGDYLELPKSDNNLYPTILGAIILGIGIALFIEYKYFEKGKRGLGIEGAIIINIIASSALMIFLVFGNLNISLLGTVILWFVGILVFVIGLVEYFRQKLFKKESMLVRSKSTRKEI
jgi:O-antigen/teichoic acid export membrane protein